MAEYVRAIAMSC